MRKLNFKLLTILGISLAMAASVFTACEPEDIDPTTQIVENDTTIEAIYTTWECLLQSGSCSNQITLQLYESESKYYTTWEDTAIAPYRIYPHNEWTHYQIIDTTMHITKIGDLDINVSDNMAWKVKILSDTIMWMEYLGGMPHVAFPFMDREYEFRLKQ